MIILLYRKMGLVVKKSWYFYIILDKHTLMTYNKGKHDFMKGVTQMYTRLGYEEISLLTKIFSNVDITTLTDEEKIIFLTLKNSMSSEKEKIDKDREYLKEVEEDFNKQKETNNFKYLCGACNGTCFPRCLGVYNKKYCNGMFECKSRVTNPDYKENQ